MSKLRVHAGHAISAIAGAMLLFVGTALHPMTADPNSPLAAFTEYAADRHWVASHLLQLSGMGLMVVALILLSRQLIAGPANIPAILGAGCALVSLAVTAALQAVDGIALKAMVNAWSAIPSRHSRKCCSTPHWGCGKSRLVWPVW